MQPFKLREGKDDDDEGEVARPLTSITAGAGW